MIYALQAATADLVEGARLAPLWWRLGVTQTVSRFRRTLLGPLWLAGGALATAVAIAFVFGGLFGGSWRENFPFIISGLIGWFLVGGLVNDGANAFITGAGMMQAQRLPVSFHIYLHLHRTLINFVFQMLALQAVLLGLGLAHLPHWAFVPGLALVFAIGLFISVLVGLTATRFRDFGHIMGFVMSIMFFLTPVFWRMDQMAESRRFIVTMNPLWHMLELLRQPLLGAAPAAVHWWVSLQVLVVSAVAAVTALAIFRKRVVFWL